jgi:hypothetical protein
MLLDILSWLTQYGLHPIPKHAMGVLQTLQLKKVRRSSLPGSPPCSNFLLSGLQPTEVLLNHTIPRVGLGDGPVAHEHGEQCISVVPQKEPYFPPPVRRTRHQVVKVGINSTPRLDQDIHSTQNPSLPRPSPVIAGRERSSSTDWSGAQSPCRPHTESRWLQFQAVEL